MLQDLWKSSLFAIFMSIPQSISQNHPCFPLQQDLPRLNLANTPKTSFCLGCYFDTNQSPFGQRSMQVTSSWWKVALRAIFIYFIAGPWRWDWAHCYLSSIYGRLRQPGLAPDCYLLLPVELHGVWCKVFVQIWVTVSS